MSYKKRRVKPFRLLLMIVILLVAFIYVVKGTLKVTEIIEEEIELIDLDPEIIYYISNNTNKEVIYLAKGDSYRLDYSFVSSIKNSKKKLNYSSSNPECVYVDINGLVKAIDNGESIITISVGKFKETVKIVSTDMILPTNNTKVYTKPYLECGTYSKEDNDFLDLILKDRINDAGYKTRAGVVAAMRFLTIEFPYRISYFFENGRIEDNIDGEGRYYHEGLYLNESRFEDLVDSTESPECWGCSLYSYTADENELNGLDCSGLVTWAIYNGGFDPGDVGAGGIGFSKKSLFYLGDRIKLSNKNVDKVKAGDLVHNEKADGHIGMVIGIEDDFYYVAQASWSDHSLFEEPFGVVVTKYNKDEFIDDWKDAMLMDSYYIENGNYTAMW